MPEKRYDAPAPTPLRSGELNGKVALITGGSSGIGLAIAELFARQGARVAILARGQERMDKAAAAINAECNPGTCLPVACDVTDERQVMAAFATVTQALGRLDIVVNNAGHIRFAPIQDTSVEMWEDMFRIHSTAYFIVAREAAREVQRSPRPLSMVFIISDNAVKPSKQMLAYNVAKSAELHMARCIADECGHLGLRVNSILPGAVFGRSAFWTREFREARAAVHGFNPDDLEEEYKKNTALGVIIDPEEVAEAALFFASDRSSKITGGVLSIDGGGHTGYVR